MTSSTQETASAKLPDFIVIGGIRCGSTTLHKVLSAHHQLYLPKKKELHYFDGYSEELSNNLSAYQQLFSSAQDGQLCGEITPDYLTTPQAFDQISNTFNQLKIIVILRDPVERLCSHYRMSCAAGFEVLPLSEAIEVEQERLKNRDKIADIFHSYSERSTYYPHIKKYRDRFGSENTHIIFLEELTEKPQHVLSALWEFLNVSELLGVSLSELIKPSNESQDLLLANKSFANRLLSKMLCQFGIKLPSLFSQNNDDGVNISNEQRLELSRRFIEPNQDLAKLIDRELPF